MKCRKIPVGLFLLLLMLVSYSQNDAALDSIKPDTLPTEIQAFEKYCDSVLVAENIPGMTYAIVYEDGERHTGGIGIPNSGDEAVTDPRGTIKVGSISKTFVALAVLKMVEQGKLDLLDEVGKLVPEIMIENPWKEEAPVRIIHLLEHTAGFDDLKLYEVYNRTGQDVSLKKALMIKEKPIKVRWKPGTAHSYSNVSYNLLGYVIEKISGRSFASESGFIKNEVFEPLGMSQTAYGEATVRGHHNGEQINSPALLGKPAAGLSSTADDMADFLTYMLTGVTVTGDTLLPVSTLRSMERPVSSLAARNGLQWGYGKGIYPKYAMAHKAFGHNGHVAGYFSTFRYVPDLRMGYALLFNQPLESGVLEAVEGEIISMKYNLGLGAPIGTDLTAEEKATFFGFYEFRNPRNELLSFTSVFLDGIEVGEDEEGIFVKSFGGSKTYYTYHGYGRFCKLGMPEATMIIAKTEDGETFLDKNKKFYLKGTKRRSKIYRYTALAMISIYGVLLLAMLNILVRPLLGRKITNLELLAVNSLPFLLLLGGLYLATGIQLTTAGQGNWREVMILLIGYAIPVTTLAGAVIYGWKWTQKTPIRIQLLMILPIIANLILCWFLYDSNLIGLRLWNY